MYFVNAGDAPDSLDHAPQQGETCGTIAGNARHGRGAVRFVCAEDALERSGLGPEGIARVFKRPLEILMDSSPVYTMARNSPVYQAFAALGSGRNRIWLFRQKLTQLLSYLLGTVFFAGIILIFLYLGGSFRYLGTGVFVAATFVALWYRHNPRRLNTHEKAPRSVATCFGARTHTRMATDLWLAGASGKDVIYALYLERVVSANQLFLTGAILLLIISLPVLLFTEHFNAFWVAVLVFWIVNVLLSAICFACWIGPWSLFVAVRRIETWADDPDFHIPPSPASTFSLEIGVHLMVICMTAFGGGFVTEQLIPNGYTTATVPGFFSYSRYQELCLACLVGAFLMILYLLFLGFLSHRNHLKLFERKTALATLAFDLFMRKTVIKDPHWRRRK